METFTKVKKINKIFLTAEKILEKIEGKNF